MGADYIIFRLVHHLSGHFTWVYPAVPVTCDAPPPIALSAILFHIQIIVSMRVSHREDMKFQDRIFLPYSTVKRCDEVSSTWNVIFKYQVNRFLFQKGRHWAGRSNVSRKRTKPYLMPWGKYISSSASGSARLTHIIACGGVPRSKLYIGDG